MGQKTPGFYQIKGAANLRWIRNSKGEYPKVTGFTFNEGDVVYPTTINWEYLGRIIILNLLMYCSTGERNESLPRGKTMHRRSGRWHGKATANTDLISKTLYKSEVRPDVSMLLLRKLSAGRSIPV